MKLKSAMPPAVSIRPMCSLAFPRRLDSASSAKATLEPANSTTSEHMDPISYVHSRHGQAKAFDAQI
ncbi:putative paired box homeotic protein (plasmid) [Rhizobium tropici CIAT 899]|nr:putative paired box homeotic protein [Rhizobium tropici CIAT 899]